MQTWLPPRIPLDSCIVMCEIFEVHESKQIILKTWDNEMQAVTNLREKCFENCFYLRERVYFYIEKEVNPIFCKKKFKIFHYLRENKI